MRYLRALIAGTIPGVVLTNTSFAWQPIKNYNPNWAIFYVIFMLIGSFFFLNLFVGVLYERFTEMQKELKGRSHFLSQKQCVVCFPNITHRRPPTLSLPFLLLLPLLHLLHLLLLLLCSPTARSCSHPALPPPLNPALTPNRFDLIETQRLGLQFKALKKPRAMPGVLSHLSFPIVTHPGFDRFVAACIGANTLVMAAAFFGMPGAYATALE